MNTESKQSKHQRLKCLMQCAVRTPRMEAAITELKQELGIDESRNIKQVPKPGNEIKESYKREVRINQIELRPLSKIAI